MIYNTGPDRFEGAILPPPGSRPNMLVLGNSFGRDFINMGVESRALSSSNVSFHHLQACPVGDLPLWARQSAQRADYIILGFDFAQSDIACMRARLAALRPLTRARFLVIGTKSFGWNDNAVMRLDPARRYAYRAKPVAEIVHANHAAARAFSPDVYVDLMAMITDREGRVPVFTPARYFISPDKLHLTRSGATQLGRTAFEQHPVLREMAARNRAADGEQPR